jgi:hypothetical protein
MPISGSSQSARCHSIDRWIDRQTLRINHHCLNLSSTNDLFLPYHATSLSNIAQQLRLQNELPLLILLARLIGLIVFPPHRLITLSADNIPHDMSTGRHIAFGGLAGIDIDDIVKEVGFAVLAAEILETRGRLLAGRSIRWMCGA